MTLSLSQSQVSPKTQNSTSPLRLADFMEAHYDDFYIEQGKICVKESECSKLKLLLSALFTQENQLKAGAAKYSGLIPGYSYSLTTRTAADMPNDSMILISHNEQKSLVCISLINFFNAFCDTMIPAESN